MPAEWSVPTVFAAAVLAVLVTLIFGKMVRDRRRGKSSCACGCQGCPMQGRCRDTKNVP